MVVLVLEHFVFIPSVLLYSTNNKWWLVVFGPPGFVMEAVAAAAACDVGL